MPQNPLDPNVVNLAKAIRTVESGGDFSARGKSGEFGAYQFMPDTWKQWSRPILGRDVVLESSTPEEQNQVAYTKIKEWKDRGFNVGQVASAWNAGEGNVNAYVTGHSGINQYGQPFDTRDYARKVAELYQSSKTQTPSLGGSYVAPPVSQPLQPTTEPSDSLTGDLSKRYQQFSTAQERVAAGEMGKARGLLRTGGAAAGAVFDVLGRTASALTPDVVEEPVMEAIGSAVGKVVATRPGQAALKTATTFAEKEPELAQDIADIANISGLVPAGFVGRAGAKAAAPSVKGALERSAEKSIRKGVDDLLTRTKGVQSAVGLAEKKNVPLRDILSERSIYEGLKVAENKVVPDEAIETIRSRIDSLLNAKRSMLPEIDTFTPNTSREEVRKRAIESIKGTVSPLDEAEMVNAINRQVDALPEMLLTSQVDALRAQFRKSARDAKGLQKRDSEYVALEKATRDIVFDITDDLPFDTRGEFKVLNNTIKNLIETERFLDKTIRGQVVKGGRLGRYIAQSIGALAGAQHGVFASLVGANLAGSISKILTNNAYGSAFKLKLIKGLTDNNEAVRLAEELLKKVKDYKPPLLPAPKSGAARSVQVGGRTIELPERAQSTMEAKERLNPNIKQPSTPKKVFEAKALQNAYDEAYIPDSELPTIQLDGKLPSNGKDKASGGIRGAVSRASASFKSAVEEAKKNGQRGFVANPFAKSTSKKELVELPKKAPSLTTKFLTYVDEKLAKNPHATLSRQEVLDFAKRPELKKGEADLLVKKLEEFEPKGTQKIFRGDQTPLNLAEMDTTKVFNSAEKEALSAFNNTPGLYFTNSLDNAKSYGKNITSVSVKPGANILNVNDIASSKWFSRQRVRNIVESNPRIKEWATNWDEDYDSAINKIVDSVMAEKKNGNEFLKAIWADGGFAEKDFVEAMKNAGIDGLRVPKEGAEHFVIYNKNALSGGKIPAQEFADSLRRDLLELKPVKVKEPQYRFTTLDAAQGTREKFPNAPIAKNYEEVVFESPITTNGSSHFPNSKNYFAHARGDEVVEGGKKIWREQEIQSDLLQKDNLERARKVPDNAWSVLVERGRPDLAERFSNRDLPHELAIGDSKEKILKEVDEFFDKYQIERNTDIDKLSPFTNDRFGERIMRERIKEKAQKGYSKYRLPTGETIARIEGFQTERWRIAEAPLGRMVTPENLKVGMPVAQQDGAQWIITDILGDGRFKAVPRNVFDDASLEETLGVNSPDKVLEMFRSEVSGSKNGVSGTSFSGSNVDLYQETFDLTGKSNPQYRRYEQWGKFLKNKYGGSTVTDQQGNTWVEIDLKPELKKLPVEAFGVAGLIPLSQSEED